MCSLLYKKSRNQLRMHCTSMLWIGIAALLFAVVECLAYCKESMAQKQVDVRVVDSIKTSEGPALNISAPKKKLTPEKANEFYLFLQHYISLKCR